ncbi:hypothetical protein H6F51_21460 [Cyanobacteria bacterium FACHB-DQ100]|nr:hypothetical protein [Cyanobacteria bacterium FACHB-DQ100]
MDFSEAVHKARVHNRVTVKQPRLWILCSFQLPDAIANQMSAIDLANTQGQFLLGFNTRPSKGECFPWNGHLWRVRGEIMQFPTRYRSKSRKDCPYVVCEYLESYSSEIQMFSRMLELSSNN